MTGGYAPAPPRQDPFRGCGAARPSSPDTEKLGLHRPRAAEQDGGRCGRQLWTSVSAVSVLPQGVLGCRGELLVAAEFVPFSTFWLQGLLREKC